MTLPDHLDYLEVEGSDQTGGVEWSPEVFCTIPGCKWWMGASWSDLADDGDIDWNAAHPPHHP